MEDNLHPVINLLIKRMESHPDEFAYSGSRWVVFIDQIKMRAEGANLAAFEKALSNVRLDEIHKDVMDELLNGDERRAKLQTDRELLYRTNMQKLAAQQNMIQKQQAYMNQQSMLNQPQENFTTPLQPITYVEPDTHIVNSLRNLVRNKK